MARKSTPANDSPKDLLAILEERFEKHPKRHVGMAWSLVLKRLEAHPQGLRSLAAMELSGGEPDVVGPLSKAGEVVFVDCAPESPAGRRSTCYDQEALESRKDHPPEHSAMGLAEAMGIRILTEAEYRLLQTLGEFDLKTSSWVLTPAPIRELGGALFCDRRYDTVFVYHNGAQSYYGARGFRGALSV